MNNVSAPPAYNDIINSQKPVYPQQSYPQQSYPQQGYPQHGYQQQSYPQQSYPHQSIVQVNNRSPAIVFYNSNKMSKRGKILFAALFIIFVIIIIVVFSTVPPHKF